MARLVSVLMGLMIGAVVMIAEGAEAEAAVSATWCTHATAQKLIGDLDGDGDSDWVCHDRVTGQKWIALRESTGMEERWSNSTLAWCSHANAVLFLGDVNGDRKADLLCKDPGRVWVDYATAAFFEGTDYQLDTPWCTHAGAQFFLGDQNSDGRVDLTCRDSAGYTALDYADSAGRYGGTDVQRLGPDFEVVQIVRARTVTVTVRNNGAAGVLTYLRCSMGGIVGQRELALGINANSAMDVAVSGWLPPSGPGVMTCSVYGRGLDGLPELFITNNSTSRELP